jgi:hypothetical protein
LGAGLFSPSLDGGLLEFLLLSIPTPHADQAFSKKQGDRQASAVRKFALKSE